MIRSARLSRKTGYLIQAAENLSCAPEGAASSLCRQVLSVSEDGEDYLIGASCLNNDGVPLQLCITSDIQKTALRLIGDPGANLPGLEARYDCARDTLLRCLESSGSKDLIRLACITFDRIIPSSEEERSLYGNGFAWIAVSPDRAGIAFYLDAEPLGQARGWAAASKWLDEILPSNKSANEVIAKLRDLCIIASMGLEGSTPEDARAKIYFRLVKRIPLSQLGLDLLISEEIVHFLHIAMCKVDLDLKGLVLSVGFSAKSGDLIDVKIDLCGHCLAYEKSKWLDIIERLIKRFELAPIPISSALDNSDCEIAFIGLGLDKGHRPRLNVYLRAADPEGTVTGGEVEVAQEDGAGYLCSLQKDDGQWNDYNLPVGICDQWITAYVGSALARYGHQEGCPRSLAAAERGAAWLCKERSYLAGWGYNAITGPDADSTAICLGLLHELDWPVRSEDQAFLRQHWRLDGGLATYDQGDAWGIVHWDVTPLGYLGLSAYDQDQLRSSFLKGLNVSRMANGMWQAYWWRNPYYSTFVTLEVLDKLGLKEPDFPVEASSASSVSINVDNAFDLACLIGIMCLRSVPFESIAPFLRILLEWQEADGRWPGHPNLRVTDASCYAPWEEPVGTYYTDEKATITTATVIRILSLLQKRRVC